MSKDECAMAISVIDKILLHDLSVFNTMKVTCPSVVIVAQSLMSGKEVSMEDLASLDNQINKFLGTHAFR